MCGRYFIEESPELRPIIEAMNRSPLFHTETARKPTALCAGCFVIILFFVACFEIIDRLNSGNNFRSRFDVGNDFVHGFVGKRRFVQGALVDAGCIDSLHGVLICLHRNGGTGIRARHEPSRAMRSGYVPVRISLADADQRAIPHVDGYQQPFSFHCGYRTDS